MKQRPLIHLYALCWNEERMLPFFFRHYDPIVERYFIFDNGSTDASLDILRAHPKVELGEFVIDGPSMIQSAQTVFNTCWKASRGRANWVIVCEADEHLYHPDLPGYLRDLPEGTSLVIPEGYQMVSRTFPEPGDHLATKIRTGARNTGLDKPELFRPDLIEESNFHAGRHRSEPTGHVQLPPTTEVKLLHYKYLGLDYYTKRLSQLRTGLREGDIEKGWGFHYLADEQTKLDKFTALMNAAVTVP